MLRISFRNSAGELDSREVRTGRDALEAINAMLDGMEIHAGDRIVVSGDEEEEDHA